MGAVQVAYMNMGFFYLKGKCGTHGPPVSHQGGWSRWFNPRLEDKDIPQVGVAGGTSESSLPEGCI